MDFRIEWKSARKKKAWASRREKAERLCYAALRLRDDRFDSIAAILIRLLASTAAPTNSPKRRRPSARQRFMPRPRNRTEMRPSMPARKRCPSLKAGLFSYALRFAVFFPPRCGMHTTLTPFCLHDFTFVSLKKPRSELYNSGALAKFVDGQLGDQILAARFPGLLQYFSCAVHDLFGYSDELAIFLGLSLVPFLGRQPLDFLHPTPCRPRAIAKPLNMLLNGLGETAD